MVGAQSWLEQGNAQFNAGRLEEAATSYRMAAELEPAQPVAEYNLGVALQRLGRHEQAMAHFQRAMELQPRYAEAHNNIGVSLQALGRHAEAIACHQRALDVNPRHGGAFSNLGAALAALQRTEEAVAQYERALALEPNNAGARHNMGTALTVLGRLEEASRNFEIACRLKPRSAEYFRSLANSKRFTAGDPALAAMEELARDLESLSPRDQVELHFALGKVYGDLQDYERSFGHYQAGNALKRSLTPYDEPGTLAFLQRIRDVFTPELMDIKKGLGNPSRVPIFIVGMIRSGTSLVEQILASHPEVFGAGELNAFKVAVAEASSSNVPFTGGARELGAAELGRMAAAYLGELAAMAPHASRVTDKMPANFRFLGLIHLAFPNARIIHTRRDPVDTCLSGYTTLFVGDQPQTYDLAELGRYYLAYEALMAHWRRVLPKRVLLEVRYEDLVDDFDQQARRIVAHCGLEWDDACAEFHRAERPVRTASATQVRQPIYRTSIGRWRVYGERLRPLLDALGCSELLRGEQLQ